MSDRVRRASGKQLKRTVVTEKLDVLARVATVTGIRQDRQTSNWTEGFGALKLGRDRQGLRIRKSILGRGKEVVCVCCLKPALSIVICREGRLPSTVVPVE